MHHFFKDHRVNILAKHVEQKPVSNKGFLDDSVDDFSPYQSKSDVEKVGTHFGAEDDDEPVEDDQHAQHGKQYEPKPEKNVNLFINNI